MDLLCKEIGRNSYFRIRPLDKEAVVSKVHGYAQSDKDVITTDEDALYSQTIRKIKEELIKEITPLIQWFEHETENGLHIKATINIAYPEKQKGWFA